MKDVNILGVGFDRVTLDQAYQRVEEFLNHEGNKIIVTPNTEIVMKAQEDPELKTIINQADLVVPDGIGVVWASKHFGDQLPERVAGFDLLSYILRQGKQKGYRIYLLGGKPGVAQRAAHEIHSKYPGVEVVGFYHGYFEQDEEQKIIDDINAKQPQFLFVAMGAPKQEKWMARHKNNLKVRVSMGVGGSIDVLAGEVKRAPAAFRSLGLEWFYRLITQPQRITRMMVLPVFVIKVLLMNKSKERMGKK